MKAIGYLIVSLLLYVMIGCNGGNVEDPGLNGEGLSDKEEPDTEWVSVAQEGISFQFDPSLASSVDFTLIPASSEEPDTPQHPTYMKFTLNIPGNADDILVNGILYVFSVEQYRQIDSVTGDTGDMIDTLTKILETENTAAADFELPYWPHVNAAQLFHSNVQMVNFKSGKGIRYLTMHVQDLSPILNEGLFYTFQGLTTDKLYYVSFSMRVSHPDLPDTWDEYFADIEYSDFYENYETSLEKDRNLLNSSPGSMFNPQLTLIDQLVESIMIDNPTVLMD